MGEKLRRGMKSLKIDDQDSSTETRVLSAFPEHWGPLATSSGVKGHGQVIYSDLNISEDIITCGMTNGEINLIDPTKLATTFYFKHPGLSCVRCSRSTSEVIYSSSNTDGKVCLWDLRQGGRLPAQTFGIDSNSKIGGGSASSSSIKPILTFDISANDQVICAGAELVGEDSFLFFWDSRVGSGSSSTSSSKLLGAYWESHSDDVTAVRFHPTQFHSLATGSTDGLINIFNLLEPNEDDALLFSLNTESSVDSLYWSCTSSSATAASAKPENKQPSLPASAITCVTHANEVQIWDADSGDKFVYFDRQKIAEAMMRSNPDAVYITGCYQSSSIIDGGKINGTVGLLTCSLKGSCTRYITVSGDTLESTGLFSDQNPVIQTAQFIPKTNTWVTFDELGTIRSWTLLEKESIETAIAQEGKASEEAILTPPKPHKKSKRQSFTATKKKPYSKDN